MEAKITGLSPLMHDMEMLKKIPKDDILAEEVRQIGEQIRDGMVVRIKRKTGNLERSVVAKVFHSEGPALAFVAIDYRYGPHNHNVEFGHGGPHAAPPHPFFYPVVRQWSGAKITRAMHVAIARAYARLGANLR